MQEFEKKQIKELIKKGFDIELIAFEFDIPIQQLQRLKEELVNDVKTNTTRSVSNKKNSNNYSKMEPIRTKYRELFFEKNRGEIKLPKVLSQQEIEIIESVIATVEENIRQLENSSKQQKRNAASIILSQLSKIQDYQLTVEQAEKLNILMNSNELMKLRMNSIDNIDKNIDDAKSRIARQLAKSIKIQQYQVQDIEELKKLEKKLTPEMVKESPMYVGGVKSQIKNRITTMQEKETIDRIKNDVPISIMKLIPELVTEEIDIQKANEIIDEEARKRVENREKTRFSLTEEQERKQILFQIQTQIIEKADKYYIENPEQTILLMQQLIGLNPEHAIRTVVENLTARKNFETAREICIKFYKKVNNQTYMRNLRNRVRNAELSDIVLKGINMKSTVEIENRYFKLIEEGLRRGNVNPRAISLGKSQDGLKNITLADVWEKENVKEK